MHHTISVLVDNRPGVLSRVAGLFSGRGFNIESLSVNETLDPTMSQMTIVTRGDERILEQITKQLNKLIDIVKVVDYESSGLDFIERELALIKVNIDEHKRSEVLSIIDIFRCKVVDVSRTHYTIEVTGDEDKIHAIIDLLRPLGIKELVRSGKAAMLREHKSRAKG
jgi:acetolactate synthase-1/3 small subunit